MANLGPVPKFQFIASSGDPGYLYKVYTYAAGTSTPLATYTDSGGGTANTNPVILDAYGTANIWFSAASYKIVVADPNDSIVYTVDNVSPNMVSGGSGLFADGSAAAPSIAFTNQSTTGIYRSASPAGVSITVGGTQQALIKANQILAKDGTSSIPSFSFINDTNSGMYSQADNSLAIATNATPRIEVSTTAITNSLPLAGVAGDATTVAYGFSATSGLGMYNLSSGLGFATSGSGKFVITSDGRIWGSGLHNNGDVTGTAAEYIASGTYTPTITNGANIASSTAAQCQWTRVGNVVTVGGMVTIDPTATGANTTFSMTLPIASNIAANNDLGGAACSGDASAESWTILGESVLNEADFDGWCTNLSAHVLAFTFVYEVL